MHAFKGFSTLKISAKIQPHRAEIFCGAVEAGQVVRVQEPDVRCVASTHLCPIAVDDIDTVGDGAFHLYGLIV